MSRNIVVFADGTGNSAAKAFKTNVWRLYQALDLTREDQIAVFDDGVGTSSFKLMRAIGLAIGVGVKRNVIDLYKFLCRNYAAGDRIYGFGFSRGAFTIRVLTGLIYREGLVSFLSEEELDRNAVAAYRAYRKKSFPTILPWVACGRALRDWAIFIWNRISGSRTYREVRAETQEQHRDNVSIHFLGLWDTVAAYGLPIDELTEAVDRWVWPMSFRDRSLLDNVQCARHALALDDERRTFFPIPWNPAPEKLQQVWFAGVHANVGGGYPDDSLAHVPLCWMIEEAAKQRLHFKEWTVAGYAAIASTTGRIYDSRSGFGNFYRYQPRHVGDLMGPGNTPLIHSSVVLRMAEGNDGYAPISLPEKVNVLPFYGDPIPFQGLLREKLMLAPAAVPQDELPVPASEKRNLQAEQEVLAAALAKLTANAGLKDRADRVDLMLDTVWWRRVVYFLTLGLALVAAAYPLLAGPNGAIAAISKAVGYALGTVLGQDGSVRDATALTSATVQPLIGLAKAFLPGWAAPWLEAIKRFPPAATILALFLVGSLLLSRFLQRRIRDRSRTAWSVKARKDGRALDRHRVQGQRRAAATTAVILILLYLIAEGLDAASRNLRLFLVLGALVSTLFSGWRMFFFEGSTDAAAPGGLLGLARHLRNSDTAGFIYRLTGKHLLPMVFLITCVLAIIFVSNRALFDGFNAVGYFCESGLEKADRLVETLAPPVTFSASAMCFPTGSILEEGGRYRIQIEIKEDWFDKSIPTDVAGFPADSFRHYSAMPLKRWWRENFFQLIARLGARGNDEYVLEPVVPLKRMSFEECMKPEKSDMSSWQALKDTPNPITDEMKNKRLACELQYGISPRKMLISEITARASGELFLYVNDAVLMWPGLTDVFYRNNSGTATVTVKRVEADTPGRPGKP
jgi:uncharacterized protein (DUF2235 family)